MSADRVLVTHAGSLPRPDDVAETVWARMDGKEIDEPAFKSRLDSAVREIVGRQRDQGEL